MNQSLICLYNGAELGTLIVKSKFRVQLKEKKIRTNKERKGETKRKIEKKRLETRERNRTIFTTTKTI